MRRRTAFMLVFFLVLACRTTAVKPDGAFVAAATASSRRDFTGARKLYRLAAMEDPDLKQRALAAVRLTNIEWRIDRDLAAAEKDVALVPDGSEQASAAWIERARMNAEVRGDFDAARKAVEQALFLAKDDFDRSRAVYQHAASIIEPVRRARLDGRCEGDAATLPQAKSELATLVGRAGPIPQYARLLLDAALLSNDGPVARAAWRGYYGSAAQSSLLASAGSILESRLPAWRGVDASAEQRRAVGMALADSRMFDEAALVLRDPCAHHAVDANDPRVAEVIAYASALRQLGKETNEYYRAVALHRAKPDALSGAAERVARSLWPQLSWEGKPSAFSQDALFDHLKARFGTFVSLGRTAGIFDLHLGHAVVDEERQVTQYGRTASLRFIALDGIVSNGFSTWIRDGQGGDGGWARADAIYQVRPLYARGPLVDWLQTSEPSLRAQRDRDIEDETKRDEQRIASDPNQVPHGVALRMERQYLDELLANLQGLGLTGDALRDAFVARMTRDTFESSIWAHEGRHAIDKKYEHWLDSPELEFRAKLSEVALGPAPREAAEAITADVPPTSPHGRADRRIGAALIGWMTAHSADIAGLDSSRAMLLQLDKLTDAQLRAAFRSIDPLAGDGNSDANRVP